MDPADNFDDLPSMPTSFLHQPHEPVFTFDQTSPLLATEAAVPEAPPTDPAPTDWPSAPTVFEPLPWITSIISHRSYMPYLTTTSTPAPSPTNVAPNSTSEVPKAPDAAQTQQAVVSKGAQIGIFVGIAVVVILGVIGCCLGLLDLRRRYKRRKERRNNRDAELTVLEGERQHRRTSQKRDQKHGLWDNLKVDANIQHREEAPSSPQSDRKTSKAGLWERVGETRHHEKEIIGRKSSTTSSERTDGEVEWLPAYVPRERVSIVSSVASLTSSANGKPIMPRSFIGEESRR